MTERAWPHLGDAPVVRARKVALSYRAQALEYERIIARYQELTKDVDADKLPEPAEVDTAHLDRKFTEWGESWHCEVEIQYGPDDEVKAKVGGPLIGIDARSLGAMRARGRIKGRWNKPAGSNGHYLYKVADIWELSTKLRGRSWRASGSTDTVSTDGGSDSE